MERMITFALLQDDEKKKTKEIEVTTKTIMEYSSSPLPNLIEKQYFLKVLQFL